MKQKIVDLIFKISKLSKVEIENLIEIPPSQEFGDYAFPCFILSKKLRKPPIEIALEMSRDLNKKLPKWLDKIEKKGPYINFYLDKNIVIEEVLSKALEDNYGSAKQKDKILIEHTSVNPNASPHVGRTRNSIIGDSIVRIFKFLGNKVEIHYYVNDVSKQIAILSLIYKKGDKFDDMLNNYVKISKQIADKPEMEKRVFELLEKFEAGDKTTTKLFNEIVKICIDGQKKIFEKFGIRFDEFDYESRYVGKSSEEILDKLDKTGKLSKDKDGRMILSLAHTKLIKKMRSPVMVLTRSNGTGLYPLRDIAYTIDKGKFGKNLIILGEDQKLYFEQVAEAVKLLGHKAPEVVHYSFVLIQDEEGKTKKMATRKGELVLLEDFYEQALKKAKKEITKRKTKGDAKKVAIGAIKYSMLKNDNNKNIIFSWDQSLNFEGDSGPYLQYSYARASSIVRKSNSSTKKKSIKSKSISNYDFKLAKKIQEFPDKVLEAKEKLNPSLIANYSFQLAQIFNEFYQNSKVIGSEDEEMKIKLVKAFRNTLKNSLHLLGIEVIEEM